MAAVSIGFASTGLLLLTLGLLIRRGMTWLIAGYDPSRVTDERGLANWSGACLLSMGGSLRDPCEEGAKTVRFFDVNVLVQTLRDLATSAAAFAVGRKGGQEQDRVRHPTSMRGHLVNAESDFGPRQARRRIRVLIAVLAGATLMALAIGGMPTARAKHGTSGGGTALGA